MCAMEDYQVEKAPPEPKDNDTIGPLNDQERQIVCIFEAQSPLLTLFRVESLRTAI